MVRNEGVNQNLDARFEYENFSPPIQRAIDGLHKEALESLPLDASAVAGFFRVPEILMERKYVEYFKAYVEIAVRQLIIGAFYGANCNISEHDIPKQVEMIKARETNFLFFGRHLAHDIAHTVIALGRNTDTGSRAALIPDFQRRSQSATGYKSEDERIQAFASMQRDENLVDFWTQSSSRTSRTSILERIQASREKHTSERGEVDTLEAEKSFIFVMCDGATPDDFTKNFFRQVFYEYEQNEMLTFEMFQKITMPFMKREAPDAARAVRN